VFEKILYYEIFSSVIEKSKIHISRLRLYAFARGNNNHIRPWELLKTISTSTTQGLLFIPASSAGKHSVVKGKTEHLVQLPPIKEGLRISGVRANRSEKDCV
jgi:hypothetical protein